jgi:hypothetical protein
MVALLITILALTVPPGIALGQAYFAAHDTKQLLNEARTAAQAGDLATALQALDRAHARASDLRAALQRVGFWRDVPGIGTQIRGLEDAASAGLGTLEGVQDLFAVFQALSDALAGGAEATGSIATGVDPHRKYKDLSSEEKREVLQRFAQSLPKLRIARDKIDIATSLWERVPQDRLLPPVRKALQPLAETLPILKKSLDQAVPLIELGLPLAGYEQPTRYLVLLQNADEMRPAGGFIGNVGTMSLDLGELSEFSFTDVYSIDNPAASAWKEQPPEPIAKNLGVPAWYMRDANWSPDYPTSAERVLDFFLRELAVSGHPVSTPPTVVMAFEPEFFKSLLTLTGPITVQGLTLNASNFFDTIQYQVEIGFAKDGVPLEKRKEIMQAIGVALMERVKDLPASRWPDLLDMATKALNRKQVMMYSRTPDLMAKIDQRGWSGRVHGTNGDYLMVADANLAALKTDGVMSKQIRYDVDAKNPEHPTATVTLTYKNTNRTIDWRYTRYRSYTRVYVPEGSQLIDSNVKPDVTKELGKTVFGAFWVIEPGKTGTLRFKYELPSSIVSQLQSGTYHFDWQKQPGAEETQLIVNQVFPQSLKTAVPAEDREEWGDNRYANELTSLEDRKIDVTF